MSIRGLPGGGDAMARALGLRSSDGSKAVADRTTSYAKIAADLVEAVTQPVATKTTTSVKSAAEGGTKADVATLAVQLGTVIPEGVLTGVPSGVLPRAENLSAPVAPIVGSVTEGLTQNLSLAARFGELDEQQAPVAGESFLQYAQRMGFPVGQYGTAATMVAGSTDSGQWYEVLQSFYG
jgi:hypothetical protein